MVQDNNFFPGVPRTLYKQRTEKPMIIGTCKDEWAYWGKAGYDRVILVFITKNIAEIKRLKLAEKFSTET